MHLPTLKQLNYLLALQHSLHFGQAAEACFVSQSAFSTAIKELESTLNVRLVDRNNKQVVITAAGLAICERARAILNQTYALAETAKQFTNPFTGSIKLGIIPTIAPYLIAPLISNVQAQKPDLQLIIEENQTQPLYEKLLSGELDALVLALPIELNHTQQQVFANDYFHLIYHQKMCPWASKTSIEWHDKSVLLLEEGHCLREHTLSACQLQQAHKIADIKASSLTSMFAMVQAGVGISYVTDLMLKAPLPPNVVAIRQANSYRQLGLVWRDTSPKSELHEFLSGLLSEICAKNG